MTDKIVLTVEEMAKELGISRSVAYKLVREGIIPSVRVSERRLLIPTMSLMKWLEEAVR